MRSDLVAAAGMQIASLPEKYRLKKTKDTERKKVPCSLMITSNQNLMDSLRIREGELQCHSAAAKLHLIDLTFLRLK